MDYPVTLSGQLPLLLKSLRKSRGLTQSELARRLGVVQSRVADIERDPCAVSVEQMLQVLAMLGARFVVRESVTEASGTPPSMGLGVHAQAEGTATARPPTGRSGAASTPRTSAQSPPDEGPRGQW